MVRTQPLAVRYGSLGLLLFAVAAVTATIMASCGGGGGSSNGGLCEQCGVSPDGPCQRTALVVPGANEPAPCPTPPSTDTCVIRPLICRRKVDSAQQRCYPVSLTDLANPDFNFRCDGSRPGGTALPEPTSTPVPSSSQTPVVAKTPIPGQVCGDGVVEGTEECEAGNLEGMTCIDFCATDEGLLNCIGCMFNTAACSGGTCTR